MNQEVTKECGRCQQTLLLTREFFPRHPGTRDGFTGICRECKKAARNRRNAQNRETVNARQRDFRERQPEPVKERARVRAREWYEANAERAKGNVRQRTNAAREEMLRAYGGKCECCGETEKSFLTIDHTDNTGREHRASLGGAGTAIIFDLKKRGWPKKGFRLLCYNCNCGRERCGGICPHELARQGVAASGVAVASGAAA